MKELPITFKSKGKQIVGMLHLPSKRNPPVLIMCHGWTGGKWGNPYFLFVKAARYFCKKGFAVLRFDHQGVGDSEGEFKDYTTTNSLKDIENALHFAKNFKGIDKSKIGLIGHSMGGMNAIITAAKNRRVKSVVTWAGVADEEGMWAYWERKEMMKRGFLNVSGYKVTLNSFKDDLKYSAAKSIKQVKIPILIINGSNDETVRSSQADLLYKNAKQPKKLLIIKDADHIFSSEKHQEILFRNTTNWFKKWLK